MSFSDDFFVRFVDSILCWPTRIKEYFYTQCFQIFSPKSFSFLKTLEAEQLMKNIIILQFLANKL